MKRSQAGFTLIELIIVIVILGILAVTAAPKFLDFGGDAKRSTLNGVKGALESASTLVYGKAIIAGVHNQATVSTTNSPVTGVALAFGYPAASIASIRAATELPEAEWVVFLATSAGPAGSDPGDVVIAAPGATVTTLNANACHVLYKPAASAGNKPVITVFGTGC